MKSEDGALNKIAKEIRKQLPSEVIDEVVEGALRSVFSSLRYSDREIEKLVEEAVANRARELLSTTFKDEVEKEAQRVAHAAIASLSKRR